MKQLNKKNGIIIFVVVLSVLYVGYRIWEFRSGAIALQKEALDNSIPTVAITHAKPSPAEETIKLPGNLQAWFQAPVYAQVSGYVREWHKDYGAQVKVGDILAEINVPALDAKYRQSKADLETERALNELAIITAERYIALRKNQAVSEQSITVKVAEAKAQAARVKAAEQHVKSFEALIRFKTIVAPYEGVVIDRSINVGDYINKEGTISTPSGEVVRNLFTVADISRMRLFVNVPERFGPFLHDGLTADVTVPQLPNRHFTAHFLTSARGFDTSTRTVVTEFVIENEDKALWPGSYATVHITAQVEKDILTIPSSAMVFQEKGTQVAVVDDDHRVRFKSIMVTRILDATVEVSEGISVNDRIINNPSAALLEGDQVRIVTPTKGYMLEDKSGSELKTSRESALREQHAP
ncbi:RND family efflux transporter, MFP subunit [Nitrosomonas sp. PY1]|uniref:efflux RND transporter periplasmic adaptor subunit n=1 Tax=Nitrosomonas sp. PY1 TaxID=1803906 RepID=UPI001FC88C8E|nr:efflux RND transporter periplasmic adaptor subunit [Nitrosomonas sp. PY1]GKS68909.1 RND family efflux transporter, MFP subunit [Nitrosomonas sp. PY1]